MACRARARRRPGVTSSPCRSRSSLTRSGSPRDSRDVCGTSHMRPMRRPSARRTSRMRPCRSTSAAATVTGTGERRARPSGSRSTISSARARQSGRRGRRDRPAGAACRRSRPAPSTPGSSRPARSRRAPPGRGCSRARPCATWVPAARTGAPAPGARCRPRPAAAARTRSRGSRWPCTARRRAPPARPPASSEEGVVVVAHVPGTAVQVAGAVVVPRPDQRGDDVILARVRQGGHVREAGQEGLVVGHDRLHGRLLEHHLRDPDAIRVAVAPPGQLAPVAAVPGEESALQGSLKTAGSLAPLGGL